MQQWVADAVDERHDSGRRKPMVRTHVRYTAGACVLCTGFLISGISTGIAVADTRGATSSTPRDKSSEARRATAATGSHLPRRRFAPQTPSTPDVGFHPWYQGTTASSLLDNDAGKTAAAAAVAVADKAAAAAQAAPAPVVGDTDAAPAADVLSEASEPADIPVPPVSVPVKDASAGASLGAAATVVAPVRSASDADAASSPNDPNASGGATPSTPTPVAPAAAPEATTTTDALTPAATTVPATTAAAEPLPAPPIVDVVTAVQTALTSTVELVATSVIDIASMMTVTESAEGGLSDHLRTGAAVSLPAPASPVWMQLSGDAAAMSGAPGQLLNTSRLLLAPSGTAGPEQGNLIKQLGNLIASASGSSGTPMSDATMLHKAITGVLMSVSLWALLSAALPGLGGLAVVSAAGVRLGYRQAKAGFLVRVSGAARFAGSGPLGVVRSGSLIELHKPTRKQNIADNDSMATVTVLNRAA
jgi:hypothetical protein